MSLVDRKKAEQLVHDLGESVHESFARVPERLELEAVLLGNPCDEEEQMEIARMPAAIFESVAQMQNDALAATPSEITSTTTTSADLSKGKGGVSSDYQAKDEQNAKQLEEEEEDEGEEVEALEMEKGIGSRPNKH